METESDHGTFGEITKIIRSASWLGYVPWVWRTHQMLMPIIGNWLGVNNRNSSFRTFVVGVVKDRESRGSDHTDILEKLFAVSKQKPDQMDFADVVSMASSNVGAGSDTTGASLRSIVYNLCKYPQYKAKLVKELEDALAAGKLKLPASLHDTNDLKYLQAVIYEGRRIHPALGMTMPRIVPPGGLEVEGHLIPAGVSIEQD